MHKGCRTVQKEHMKLETNGRRLNQKKYGQYALNMNWRDTDKTHKKRKGGRDSPWKRGCAHRSDTITRQMEHNRKLTLPAPNERVSLDPALMAAGVCQGGAGGEVFTRTRLGANSQPFKRISKGEGGIHRGSGKRAPPFPSKNAKWRAHASVDYSAPPRGGPCCCRDLAAVPWRLTTAVVRAFLLRSLPMPPGVAPRRPLP